MYLKYGTYRHAPGEVSVAISKQGIFSDAGISRGVRERWEIQGRLQAADQSSLSTAIAALVAAYSQQAQDAGFYFDNDQPTSHVIVSAASNGGVRVIGPPSFPQGKGAEYSTFRTYTIALEAEWLDPTATLLSWNETLSFDGGGPQVIFLEPINGLPQRQLLKQATTYRAAQSGRAVGYLGYPFPPAPLWPAAEHVDRRQIRYELPDRSGPIGAATYTQFGITWSYSFEDAAPLIGFPTPWPA